MSAELLVNVAPQGPGSPWVENGSLLQEVRRSSQAKRGISGRHICKGRISQVLLGMRAAFVDIGMDKAAFLHAFRHRRPTEVRGDQREGAVPGGATSPSWCARGQDIMCGWCKDPLGTMAPASPPTSPLPSRYLVFMPGQCPRRCLPAHRSPRRSAERLKRTVAGYVDELGG